MLRLDESFALFPTIFKWILQCNPTLNYSNIALLCRCNDVLELVQTTRHFRLLSDAAEIGGAGTQSLDNLVKEIHTRYSGAMDEFFTKVTNVLAIDGTQAFEKAFFVFRTIVKVCHKLIFSYYL